MSDASDQASRWRLLLDALAERRQLSVADAAALLGVSPATVRRDFGELARQQLATRTHGGIVATSVAYDLPARYRVNQGDPIERIGQAAAALVEPGSVVAFNGGTTTSAVARHLGRRTDLGQNGAGNVIVVTNALNIASEMVLRPAFSTLVIGGVARPESYELHGRYAEIVLRDLRVHRLFLGVNAFSAARGAACNHLGEAGINAEMVKRAKEVTVVASGAKLGRLALATICEADAVSTLITDESAPADEVARLEEIGVDVVRV